MKLLEDIDLGVADFEFPLDVVSWMGAMQAQDYTMSKWAVGIRLKNAGLRQVNDALAKGEIVRTHILRPTWHYVAGKDLRWMRQLTSVRVKKTIDSWVKGNGLDISEEHYNSLKEKFPVPKASDIMISAVGTIGKCYIVKESDKFYYKDASVLCLCNDYQINTKYIYHIMRSEYMLKQMYDNSKGTTVDTITIEKAKQYILPLPPLAEQQRIVAKIEETFSIFDGIQNSLEA